MRRLTFGMNVSLDGYTAAPGDDVGTFPGGVLLTRYEIRR